MRFLDYENGNALSLIKEQFNLATVYHYDCNFTSSELLAYPDIFKESLVVHPECSLKTGEIVHPELKVKTGEISILRDGHYINCKINIDPDVPLQEIKNQVAFFVKYARSEILTKDTRQRFDSNMTAYQIYDLRIDRMSFLKISRKLGIKEENTRQKYRRAYELIHNEKYGSGKITELTEQHFVEQEQWDRFEEVEKAQKELILTQKHIYKAEHLTYEEQADLTETIQSIKEECENCDDNDCSTKMVSNFDNWLLDVDSEPDFSNADPCPELREMLFDMFRWRTVTPK